MKTLPPRFHTDGPDTEKRAALKGEFKALFDRVRALRILRDFRQADGITGKELESIFKVLGRAPWTGHRRLHDLVLRGDAIRTTMEREGCTVVVAKEYWTPDMGRIPPKRVGKLTALEQRALRKAKQGHAVWWTRDGALHVGPKPQGA